MSDLPKGEQIFQFDEMPAHAEFTDGRCPGIFILIEDGNLKCNECGMTILELCNQLEMRPTL